MTASSFDPVPRRRVGHVLLRAAIGVGALLVAASLALTLWALSAGSGPEQASPSGATTSRGPASVLSRGFVGVALAEHDHDVLVGLGVRAGGPVDIVVVPSDESDLSPSEVRVRLAGELWTSGSSASSCGPRCLRFGLAVLAGRPSTIEVAVVRTKTPAARVDMQLPARLPPSAGPAFRRARTEMLRLRSLAMDETLGTGLSAPVVSHWTFEAPDRMRYAIEGGSQAVVIGTRRWDRDGGRWERTEATRLRVPAFPWQSAVGARLVGAGMLGGRPVRVLAVHKPDAEFPTWFLLDVDNAGRV